MPQNKHVKIRSIKILKSSVKQSVNTAGSSVPLRFLRFKNTCSSYSWESRYTKLCFLYLVTYYIYILYIYHNVEFPLDLSTKALDTLLTWDRSQLQQ